MNLQNTTRTANTTYNQQNRLHAEAESILRDVAYVLKLTQQVRKEILQSREDKTLQPA